MFPQASDPAGFLTACVGKQPPIALVSASGSWLLSQGSGTAPAPERFSSCSFNTRLHQPRRRRQLRRATGTQGAWCLAGAPARRASGLVAPVTSPSRARSRGVGGADRVTPARLYGHARPVTYYAPIGNAERRERPLAINGRQARGACGAGRLRRRRSARASRARRDDPRCQNAVVRLHGHGLAAAGLHLGHWAWRSNSVAVKVSSSCPPPVRVQHRWDQGASMACCSASALTQAPEHVVLIPAAPAR